MKKILLFLFVALFVFGSVANCFAALPGLGISYDVSDQSVTAYGTANGKAVIYVVPFGSDETGITSTNPPIDLYTLTSYGEYSFDFEMPRSAKPGKYTVCIVADGGKSEESFLYFLKSEADTVAQELNSIDDADEYTQYLRSNSAKAGIDTTDSIYEDNIDGAAEIMSTLGLEFSDGASLNKAVLKYLNVSDMKGKTQPELEALLQKEADILEIDFTADYDAYQDDEKAELCTLLAEGDYIANATQLSTPDFKNVLAHLAIAAKINVADGYREIQEIYEADLSDIIEANSYYTPSYAKDIFSEIVNMKYSSVADLKNNFDRAAETVYFSSNNSSGGSSGGGSSGGGFGGGSYSVPPTTVNPGFDSPADNTQSGDTHNSSKLPVFAPSPSAFYTDFDNSHWAYGAVSALSECGALGGYPDGSFCPSATITRAEFAKMVVSLFSFKGNSDDIFNDVEDEWFAEYVNIAADNGIVQGFDGNFNPYSQIKRQDAFLIAYRVAKKMNVTYNGTYAFEDMNDVDLYAWSAIYGLSANGIIRGDDKNRVNPHSSITRAETAQLLYNLAADMRQKISG